MHCTPDGARVSLYSKGVLVADEVCEGYRWNQIMIKFITVSAARWDIFCTSTARCYSSCVGMLICVVGMKFREQIHYCLPFVPPKMIGKTQAISILTNNIGDHAIRVGQHTAASEILAELTIITYMTSWWRHMKICCVYFWLIKIEGTWNCTQVLY